MQEIYKDIPSFEGYYQVSNLGNVKSLERTILRRCGKKMFIKEKVLSLVEDNIGYYTVSLRKDNKTKYIRIHSLVAIAFLGHKPNRHHLVVDHIDNNPLNNKVENLQIVTNRENTLKDRKRGLSKYCGVTWFKGKWVGRVKINKVDYYLGRFKTEIEAHIACEKKRYETT